MKTKIAIVSLLVCASSAWSETTLREFSWSAAAGEAGFAGGTVLPADDRTPFERLKVARDAGRDGAISLLTIKAPPVTTATYALVGRVRHEAVAGDGYLEMLSYFPGRGWRYSRTLEGRGPMKKLTGTSAWRRFVLPFYMDQAGAPPTRLAFKAVFPGGGTVFVGPVRLVQYAAGEDPLAAAGAWWTDRQGGLLGGVFGCVIGGLGGLLGLLGGRGKARRFVIGSLRAMAIAGAALLVSGVVAVVRHQPYGVYYPLLLAGGLLTVLGTLMAPVVRRRYRQMELRKMQAMDAG